MPRILLIAAIFLMIGASVLGILTKGKFSGLRTERDTWQAKSTSANLAVTDANKKVAAVQKERNDAKAASEAKDKEVAAEKAKADEATAKLTPLQEDIEAKKKRIAELEIQVGKPKDGGPVINVAEWEEKLRQAEAKALEQETVAKTLADKLKVAEGETRSAQEKEIARQHNLMKNGTEATVMAYNPSWNFVVLNLGDKRGAAMNAEMIIKRDGTRVATVKITSVEPNTSVADIVPGSVAKGMRVMPGDRAIFER